MFFGTYSLNQLIINWDLLIRDHIATSQCEMWNGKTYQHHCRGTFCIWCSSILSCFHSLSCIFSQFLPDICCNDACHQVSHHLEIIFLASGHCLKEENLVLGEKSFRRILSGVAAPFTRHRAIFSLKLNRWGQSLFVFWLKTQAFVTETSIK